jgi:hypothetical protein
MRASHPLAPATTATFSSEAESSRSLPSLFPGSAFSCWRRKRWRSHCAEPVVHGNAVERSATTSWRVGRNQNVSPEALR